MVEVLETGELRKQIKEQYESLLKKEIVSTWDLEEFEKLLDEVKGILSKHEVKKMRKTIKKKTHLVEFEGSITPGPKYEEKDIKYLRKKIKDFFKSPDSAGISKGHKIKFYLFGSLITGFCNHPRKKHYGKPTDEGRLSDVDILVVIPKKLFFQVFRLQEIVEKVRGTIRTRAIGEQTTGTALAGPFQLLFEYLKHLHFAGKKRPISLVFVPEKDFKEINYEEEPNLEVIEIKT